MIDLISSSTTESSFIIVFSVSLLFAVVSGPNLRIGQRVSIIYAFCLILNYFQVVSLLTSIICSAVVLFLLLEVFNSDKDLVRLFSVPVRIVDFVYRLIFEVYFGLYIIALVIQYYVGIVATNICISIIVNLLVWIILVAITARMPFASKPVTEIIKCMKKTGEEPVNCSLNENDQKIQILLFMEDRFFFKRSEKSHTVFTLSFFSRLVRKLTKINLLESFKKLFSKNGLRKYLRGFGTIEMQILRNIGLESGSYKFTFRRKVFELLYSQILFNSYINQLSEGSFARNNIKNWMRNVYISAVSVKFGPVIYEPIKGKNTIKQLFEKDFSELSNEQLFVWCLGLPYYREGVGKKAVDIHRDVVERFSLDEDKIYEIIFHITCDD